MKINLFINVYSFKNEQRFNEVFECLKRNISNPSIDRIVCLDEGFNFTGLDTSKCVIIPVDKRLTFSDFYEYLYGNEINIIANNDIYFDTSIKLLKRIILFKNVFVGLTRREEDGTLFRSDLGDSQDVWAFYSKPQFLSNCKFYLGVPGCDSKLLFKAWNKKYLIVNPAFSIKCGHLHKLGNRSYTENDRVFDPYLRVRPSTFMKSLYLLLLSWITIRILNLKILREDQSVL